MNKYLEALKINFHIQDLVVNLNRKAIFLVKKTKYNKGNLGIHKKI